jgi:CRP-like cAMP-binding protein
MGTANTRVIQLLDGIDPKDFQALLDVGHEVSFAPDQSIFEDGDRADAMYIVLDGEAQVDVGGRFHRLRRGAIFGEMALLAPDRRMATVRTVESVRALKVPVNEFRTLLLARPQIGLSMLRLLALRLREVEQRVDAWMAS